MQSLTACRMLSVLQVCLAINWPLNLCVAFAYQMRP